jgi:hypothetical protein
VTLAAGAMRAGMGGMAGLVPAIFLPVPHGMTTSGHAVVRPAR